MISGKELKKYRVGKDRSQSAVAMLVGRSQNWLSMVECGKLAVDSGTATKILEAIDKLAETKSVKTPPELAKFRLPSRIQVANRK